MTKDRDEATAEIERLDRFFGGEERGEVPIDLLRASGLDLPDDDSLLDDATLHTRLWELIIAMAGIGMVLEDTDHLSDRGLYRFLVTDGLKEEAPLSPGALSTWHLSAIGCGSEEDGLIHLRYYADDDARQRWEREFGGPIPLKEPLPFDRDRLLPISRDGKAVVQQDAARRGLDLLCSRLASPFAR